MRLVCFGDSNTYGYDPRDFWGGRYACEDRWPDLLAQQTGIHVENLGSNGAEIPSCADAISPQLRESDFLLVMLGTNDLLQGLSPEETAARMKTFLQQLLLRHRRILLILPPPMKRGSWVASDSLVEASRALAGEYRQLAEQLKIPFADTRRWNVDLTFDGVHFSEEGHHTFAANIVCAVQPWLYTSG